MTIDEATAKLQRRLMVADCPAPDPAIIATIAALFVDVDREAYERGSRYAAHLHVYGEPPPPPPPPETP